MDMVVSIVHICNQLCVKFIDLSMVCFSLRNPLSGRLSNQPYAFTSFDVMHELVCVRTVPDCTGPIR